MRKQLFSLVAASGLLLSACGSDDSDSGSDAAQSSATSAASTAGSAPSTAVPVTTAASSTAAPSTSAASTTSGSTAASAPAPAAAAETTVMMREWEVQAPSSLATGARNFAVTNNGEAAHEFVVMQGTYETLPRSSTGTVLEDQLAAGALVGRTDRIDAGSSASLSVELTAGQYVLLCNISVGPNSHAGKGQRLDVTVA